jgi:hypothetical protein
MIYSMINSMINSRINLVKNYNRIEFMDKTNVKQDHTNLGDIYGQCEIICED